MLFDVCIFKGTLYFIGLVRDDFLYFSEFHWFTVG
jgi:hypothetical protein